VKQSAKFLLSTARKLKSFKFYLLGREAYITTIGRSCSRTWAALQDGRDGCETRVECLPQNENADNI
jgi:hypothetical protein